MAEMAKAPLPYSEGVGASVADFGQIHNCIPLSSELGVEQGAGAFRLDDIVILIIPSFAQGGLHHLHS